MTSLQKMLLAFTAGASVVAAATLLRPPPTVPGPSSPPADSAKPAASPLPGRPPTGPPPAGDPRNVERLEAEISALKKKIAELEAKRPPEERPAGEITPPRPVDRETIQKWQAIAMDPSKDPLERVDALKNLRITPMEPDGRTPEVVRAMLELFQASPDAKIRADIFRHTKRYVPLEFSGVLVKALASDPDEKVREEAAETLGPLNADPTIRAALESAAKLDSSERVRRQAEASAKGH